MSYTATLTKDLSATTPTEGSTLPSELNDAIREIKSCMLYEKGLLAKTADYSMDAKDNIVICTPASVDITVTLPQASACSTSAYFKLVMIRNYGAYDVIIDGYSDETIDAAATLTIRPSLSAILVCNGTGWYSFRPQPKFRGARVTNSIDITINASDTTLTFDTETYDTDSIHSASVETGRLTVPSGVSYVRLITQFQMGSTEETDQIAVKIMKNGSTCVGKIQSALESTEPINAGWCLQVDSGVVSATADDYFTVVVTGCTNTAESDYTWFAMEIIE